MAEVTAILPTLGRPELQDAIDSINNQSVKVKLIVKPDPGTVVSKFNEGLHQCDTEFIALLDDDGVYPRDYIRNLLEVMKVDHKVGFAAGAVRPITKLKGDATKEQLTIAAVVTSFFGTTNMSQRNIDEEKIEDRDETNLPGVGLWRTKALLPVYENWEEKVPHAFHDTYQIYALRKNGWKTVYVPDGFFYHAVKRNLKTFCNQMYRSGTGRMNFFKLYPGQAIKKPWILGPAFFMLYLPLAFLFPLPLVLYGLMVVLACATRLTKLPKLPLYLVAMHLSYGFGLLAGLFVHKTNWK